MKGDCPVCDAPVPPSEAHCGTCGFPRALVDRLDAARLRSLGATPGHPSPLRAERPARSEEEIVVDEFDTLVAAIGRKTDALRELGSDTTAIDRSLAEAAVHEALGRAPEAARELAAVEERAAGAVRLVVSERTRDLQARLRILADAGVDAGESSDLADVTPEMITAEPERAASIVKARAGTVAQLERERRTNSELRREIAKVRKSAARLGLAAGGPSEVAGATEAVGETSGGPRAETASDPAEELGELRRSLAPAVTAELERHGEALAAFPADSGEGSRARTVRERAAADLAAGRLADALARLQDLRSALVRLSGDAKAPAHRAPAREAGATPGTGVRTPSAGVSIDTLLAKARSFADRIRALPPGSEVGRRAARQIREATDLLRQGRLDEADSALSRLMVSLDRAEEQA